MKKSMGLGSAGKLAAALLEVEFINHKTFTPALALQDT